MQLTKRQMEFWTVILVLCIGTAIAVLLVDFGIKAAILEESTRLRLRIEEWERENGRRPESSNTGRIDNDSSVDPPLPSDVLVVDATGMEEGFSSNGAEKSSTSAGNRRPKSHGETAN